MSKFKALNAQVVGVSTDFPDALKAFKETGNLKHLLLSDFPRKMLPTYDAMVTDPNSVIYRYAKRAYYILDKNGTVKWIHVMDNPTVALEPDDVLKAIKESGAGV